jgi:hypothetical protein
MRVLYIASNPQGQTSLRLEQDITELQRVVDTSNAGRASFIFLPAIPFEDMEHQIAVYRPDVLHVSAHGTPDYVKLADSLEGGVELTAISLKTLISSYPPKLLVLSACTSQKIAEELTDTVPFAIGTTQDITNLAARKSAVNLYRKLLRGESLQSSFDFAQATVRTLSNGDVDAVLAARPGAVAGKTFLSRLPKIVAHFDKHKFAKKDEYFTFFIGLHGASSDTVQVIFATDDDSFIGRKPDNLEDELSSIVRGTAIESEIWIDYTWYDIYGDFRIYAMAITADGKCYCVSSTLCQALTDFYTVYFDGLHGAEFPEDLKIILEKLRRNDGAQMRPRELVAPKRKQRLAAGGNGKKSKKGS